MNSIMLLTAAITVLGILAFVTKLYFDVRQIHKMVNSRMKEALERIEQLEAVLTAHGILIPARLPREKG